MGTIKTFEELEVWQESRKLSKEIYDHTEKGSFKRDYSLITQINKSTGSIMDNIAEGFERDGTREFVQFLSIAKGSCGEVRSQLHRASDRGHLSQDDFLILHEQCLKIIRMIRGLMRYLRSTDMKGFKFEDTSDTYNPTTP